MTRASYPAAVKWIAENDEPMETDTDAMSGLLTVLLVADLFGKPEEQVASDVLRERGKAVRS